MQTIKEIRQKYPQYNDMSDQEFADAFHKKYYSDMPKEEVYSKLGINQEPQGWSGVGHDIFEAAKAAPGEAISGLLNIAKETPGALLQGVKIPWEAAHGQIPRATKNLYAGAGEFAQQAAHTPHRIAEYLSKKGIISPETANKVWNPKKIDIKNVMGLEGNEAGDPLWQSALPAALFGAAGETGAATGLARAGQRAAAGGAYGMAGGENPITSAMVASALPAALSGIKKLPETTKKITANQILKTLNKRAEQGHNLTPEQANENLLTNYLNEQGQPMPIDIGNLTQNQFLQDLYGGTSKVPFARGRKQLSDIRHQMQQKNEAVAEAKHVSKIENLKNQEHAIHEALREQEELAPEETPDINKLISEKIKQHGNLEKSTEQANLKLEQMRHKKSPHEKLLRNDIETADKITKKEAEQLYKPVNDFDVNLSDIKEPENFKGHYEKDINEFAKEAKQLRALFGDESDIGRELSSELKRGLHFFKKPEPINMKEEPGAPKQIGEAPKPKVKPVYLKDILAHVRTLHKAAATLKERGENIQASKVSKLAVSLKKDIKDLLNYNGHEKIASALEEADNYFIKNRLPFYSSKEIKNALNNKEHILDTAKVADILHNKNYDAIMSRLSPEARKAAAYELLTKGRYNPTKGTNLTPKELATRFEGLDKDSRAVISKYLPEIEKYFGNLKEANNLKNKVSKRIELLAKNKEALEKIGTKAKESEMALQEALKAKFGKYKGKTTGLVETLKNAHPMHVTGIAAALYALNRLHPTALLAEGAIPAIYAARGLNKLLTNPELIKAYMEKRPMHHQPMELELTTGNKAKNMLPYLMNQRTDNGNKQ